MIKLVTEFPVECRICKSSFTNVGSLSKHLKSSHEINQIDYTIKYLLDNRSPICKCGCNKLTKVYNYSYNEYCLGHTGGGFWQFQYDKDSEEYKTIVRKISNSVKEYAKYHPTIITEKQRLDSSKRMKELYQNNPDEFKRRISKMTQTKRMQSDLGILQERHWIRKLTEEELKIKLQEIGIKISISKQNNPKPAWNKGLSCESDSRIEKWSGENHYKYNPDKSREYTKLFRNKVYRSFILETQEYLCFGCGCEEFKNKHCLHHIDEVKSNHKFENLIFVCRSCHSKIHNNTKFKDNFNISVQEFKCNLLKSNALKEFIAEYRFEII